MTETNFTTDSENLSEFQTQTLPRGLNVLTILTFIGCALGAIFTLATPWLMKFSLNMMNKAAETGTDLTPKQNSDMEASKKVIELTQANMTPLLLIGAAGIVLCFIGALMMRKLKKDGFWIYVSGQVLPIIGSLALLGMAQFTGVTSYIMFLIPIVFIILYSMQRKYLVK